jgi:putative DNA primase/helicase
VTVEKPYDGWSSPGWKTAGEEYHKERAGNLDNGGSKRHAGNSTDQKREAARRLLSRRASDIVPKDIDFIWEGRLARGKHTCIGGEPGGGKSQLSINVTATVTTAGLWPCGEGRAPLGNVLILNAEDGAEDMIRPRLEVAGADLNRVHIVNPVIAEDGKGQAIFNLQADLELLERKVDDIGDVALIIIDPVSSYMGKADSHKNAEVRGVLEPISAMAERKRVAILSITHFSKAGAATTSKALHRFIGSVAFVGAPRAAFAVIEDADNEGRMLFLHAKNNMAKAPQGLAFRLAQRMLDGLLRPVSYIVWESAPVDITANEALAANTDGAEARSAQSEAKEFLEGLLGQGPVLAKDGEEAVRAHGIARRTLMRARKTLGIIAEKDGLKGWSWRLPPPKSAKYPEECQVKGWHSSAQVGILQERDGPKAAPPALDPADPGPIPECLLRAPKPARPPALGPLGDSLDDFE